MKKSKIIAPALGVLVLSTAASISGTVAWFTANNSVNVSGMTVKTHVSSNLMIYGDILSSTAKTDDENFTTLDLEQEVEAILEPVSTVDGSAFYYTTNARGDGDAAAESYTLYNASTAATGEDAANYANKFSQDYGITTTLADDLIDGQTAAVAYVDYVFQLKAVNADSASKYLSITTLDLTYTKAASEVDANKAFRVALSVEDITTASAAGAFKTTADGIFAPSDAENFSDANSKNFAVSSTSTVAQLSVTGNKYNNTNLGQLASIAAGATKYYKVIARLYIEGEDTTCTNDTFAALNGEWALTLDLALNDGTCVSALTIA